jgi:uncharacterized protein (TIGR02246 family)
MSMHLEDIERIKQLKYRYCRAIDLCDTAALRTMFTEDASVDYLGGSYHFEISGRDAIVDMLRDSFYPQFVGCHTVHQPVIEVHDDDTADGEWTLLDYALKMDKGNEATVGAATYKDHYVKRDGAWLIHRATYQRVYERVYTEQEVGLTAHLLGERHRLGLAGK